MMERVKAAAATVAGVCARPAVRRVALAVLAMGVVAALTSAGLAAEGDTNTPVTITIFPNDLIDWQKLVMSWLGKLGTFLGVMLAALLVVIIGRKAIGWLRRF